MQLLPKVALSGALFVAMLFSGDTLIAPIPSADASPVRTIHGSASWYGGKFHGRRTANGERFDMHALTAAHKSLRFGTKVRVTNRKNGKSVVVRINDRGPYAKGRVIDLSRAAAATIGMIGSGIAMVQIDILP